MAKNLGREFATMSEDERRKFALEEGGKAPETPEELDFDDPRERDAPNPTAGPDRRSAGGQ
jgi:hypothetical protein